MKPATISSNGLTVAPTIFKIAEYSIWVFSLTGFPIPLETECYIKIYIPPDLGFENTVIEGSQMMAPKNGSTIENVKMVTEADGGKSIMFQACY